MAVEAPAAPAPAGTPPRSRPGWVDSLVTQGIALITAFVVAGVIGSVIIAAYGENPVFVYSTMWQFSTARAQDVAKVLENATPLIFSGLAVAVAFRAGMFNIGVEGQYIVGMMTAAPAAIFLDVLPGPLHLLAVVLAAVIGAMAWAAVPAILKVKTGAHEVVTTIMMNGIAVSLVAWALLNPLRTSERNLVDLRSDRFPESGLVPNIAPGLGLEEQIPPSVHLTWLFPVALAACLFVWYLLYRTRLGYETRAVGSSAGSAEAGGISIGGTQIKVFLISGALAGLVGLNHLLGDAGYLGVNYETTLGFTGIAVAFLGRNHPAGIAAAAILLGVLTRGEDGLAIHTELPREIVVILEGLLILSVVIAYQISRRVLLRRRQRLVRAEEVGSRAAA
ncbi:MAG TPA: ABC transporter permease [Actinomycetota bacterium]|nr:ABC transporter permease [Actinomycetota bacterium]